MNTPSLELYHEQVLRKLFAILALLTIFLGVFACRHQQGTLSGKWIAWSMEKGEPPMQMNKPYSNVYVEFGKDGKFHFFMENHIMSNVLIDGTGTYKKDGQYYVLTGTAKFKMDDGYKKEDNTGPLEIKMEYSDGVLTWDPGGAPMKFYKEGVKPEPILIKLKDSDAAGTTMLKALQKRYANLTSYADNGVMTSPGEGWMATRCPFKIRFVRPNKLLVEADYFEKDGGHFGGLKVWSNGKVTMEREADTGEPLSDPFVADSISGAFRTQIGPGECCVQIIQLLMPNAMEPLTNLYVRANSKGKDTISGHRCSVLLLTSEHDYTLKLWIDDKTGLILRAYSNSDGETDNYSPIPNPRLTAADLKPSK